MNQVIVLYTLIVFICLHSASTLKYPRPKVFVVTPSPRTLQQIDEARAAPFYYHSWRRRMDPPANVTTTTTTTKPTAKTPDLIFAEFESDSMRTIRKLLEKEKAEQKTTTTFKPIYVPDEDVPEESQNFNYGVPPPTSEKPEESKDMTDYFALYNNLYGIHDSAPAPVYFPPTVGGTPTTSTAKPTSPPTTTTTASQNNNVENIWHIIESEKHNQYNGQWDEVLNYESDQGKTDDKIMQDDGKKTEQDNGEEDDGDVKIDDNFALPGFVTHPGHGAENESRAIRTEPNARFPYVNLKPFQMKNPKKPINAYGNGKKGSNMYSSLDNFFEMKNPVRGEAQDVVVPMRQPVDRYNPAQPYLPAQYYGNKAKQSSQSSTPMKAVANLVPPPLPPVPKLTANDFPAPITYESYPPYAPSAPDSMQPPPPPVSRPASMPQPPPPQPTDSDDGPPDSDGPPIDSYQPPSPPTQIFLPTLPPLKNPYGGYSYNKPAMTADAPPTMDMNDKPDFGGYHYAPAPQKPDFHGYHYSKPDPPKENKPDFSEYQYEKPAPEKPEEHDFHGYHYSKPEEPEDHPPISFDHHHHGPPFGHDDDDDDTDIYPGLTFHKPHGDMDDTNGGDDMKGGDDDMKGGGDMKGGDDDMGMMPPPPPADMKPMDDSGFPHDFPGDLKFHHDFDDDFYHHHHHHTTTTTTTTTEMPRVNRYSYYYLGKKLYYLPLYFSVYFIIYVGALIIKAVLRHKIVYPNSWRPNDDTASFFSKRSVDSWDLSNENLHEMTGKVTHAIATAAEKYINKGVTKNE